MGYVPALLPSLMVLVPCKQKDPGSQAKQLAVTKEPMVVSEQPVFIQPCFVGERSALRGKHKGPVCAEVNFTHQPDKVWCLAGRKILRRNTKDPWLCVVKSTSHQLANFGALHGERFTSA